MRMAFFSNGPEGEDFHFPIVTGMSENLARDEREKRMQVYQEFMKNIDLVKPGSSDRVSEADLGIRAICAPC